MSLHGSMADTLRGFGGLLRCQTCGREEQLGDIAGHLRGGWPKCCGYTMRWLTASSLTEPAEGEK